MSDLIEAVNRFAINSDRLEQILNHLYFDLQMLKAFETPRTFRVNTVYINQTASFQMLANNPRRKRVIIINNGDDNLLFSYEPFDSIQASIMDTLIAGNYSPQAQVQGGVILPQGPLTVIETTSALHVVNFASGEYPPFYVPGAAITYIEELFSSSSDDALLPLRTSILRGSVSERLQ